MLVSIIGSRKINDDSYLYATIRTTKHLLSAGANIGTGGAKEGIDMEVADCWLLFHKYNKNQINELHLFLPFENYGYFPYIWEEASKIGVQHLIHVHIPEQKATKKQLFFLRNKMLNEMSDYVIIMHVRPDSGTAHQLQLDCRKVFIFYKIKRVENEIYQKFIDQGAVPFVVPSQVVQQIIHDPY